jgi:phospholipase C
MHSDPIKHIVVLMLENHSFDQMLGSFRSVFPDVEGVDPAHPIGNQDDQGRVYAQAATTAVSVSPDPMHDLANVSTQLEGGNAGFVLDYSKAYPQTTTAQRQQIMSYFAPGVLPGLHELARHFCICDHWYSSVPGPTWTNRFFVHSGTSLGRVAMPSGLGGVSEYFEYDQDTLYDRLNERGVSWRIYYGDVPQSLVLTHQRTIQNSRHYERMEVFFSDANGQEERFPAFAFIEPKYFWPGQNDDHPPHTTPLAQQLVATVYSALRRNEPLWQSTLLVVLYDEHGGFFDHVSPPAAVPPDAHAEEYTFDRLGVRVPGLLVSPWVDRTVLKDAFDRTSLLRYLTDKWSLGPLGNRTAGATSFAGAIRTTGRPRDDTPASIELPQAMLMAAAATVEPVESEPGQPLNAHQKALIAFTEHLEQEIEQPVGKPTRVIAMSAGASAQVETAKSRVELFLAQQKTKAVGP